VRDGKTRFVFEDPVPTIEVLSEAERKDDNNIRNMAVEIELTSYPVSKHIVLMEKKNMNTETPTIVLTVFKDGTAKSITKKKSF